MHLLGVKPEWYISGKNNQTGSLDISAFASWTIEGGGQSETTEITEVCHEVPPDTTEEPPIEVGGVSAERPAAEAAAAVTAEPRFAG